jgi:hypothetical protein
MNMLRRKVFFAAVGCLAAWLLVGCGSGGSNGSMISAIRISSTEPSIAVSGRDQFAATVTDANGNVVNGIAFTWASTVPTIATIDASAGSAMGLFPGTMQITASAGGITSNPVTLFVTPGFLVTGSLSTARFDATATLLGNGMVLIAGGYGSTGDALTSAELYDPATHTFTVTGSLMTPRYWGEAGLIGSGRVLVAGGYNTSGFVDSAELYDPVAGTFSPTGNMVLARRLFTMTVLQDG